MADFSDELVRAQARPTCRSGSSTASCSRGAFSYDSGEASSTKRALLTQLRLPQRKRCPSDAPENALCRTCAPYRSRTRIGSKSVPHTAAKFSGRVPRRISPAAPGRPRRRCRSHKRGQRCGDAGVRKADDACIREVGSGRAALPPRSPWRSNGSATWPDSLRPVHRHDVGACEFPNRRNSCGVAVAMRRGCPVNPGHGPQPVSARPIRLEACSKALRTPLWTSPISARASGSIYPTASRAAGGRP
jgi:hypothetical protein